MLIKIALVILAVLIVGSIMLQQGKGSDLGSAFGGGSSDSLFDNFGFDRKRKAFADLAYAYPDRR